jgi:hypothetical protein
MTKRGIRKRKNRPRKRTRKNKDKEKENPNVTENIEKEGSNGLSQRNNDMVR